MDGRSGPSLTPRTPNGRVANRRPTIWERRVRSSSDVITIVMMTLFSYLAASKSISISPTRMRWQIGLPLRSYRFFVRQKPTRMQCVYLMLPWTKFSKWQAALVKSNSVTSSPSNSINKSRTSWNNAVFIWRSTSNHEVIGKCHRVLTDGLRSERKWKRVRSYIRKNLR